MCADMSVRSAAEMNDSQEPPVSLPTVTPKHTAGRVGINTDVYKFVVR